MTVPIFNLGRRDLPWALLIFVIFAFAAILLYQDSVLSDDLFEHAFMVFCAVASSAFFGISLAKIIWGKGDFCPADDEMYETIVDSNAEVQESQVRQNYSSVGPTHIPPNQGLERVEKSSLAKTSAFLTTQVNAYSSINGKTHEDHRVLSTSSMHSARLSPRDRDIDCGIEIAKALEDFEYHSVIHPKGSIRITRVHRDGVSERQGACSVGDVLVSVDGQDVSSMDVPQVRSMLRGRAGTTILLGLFTEVSREPISRQVVLAPAPGSFSRAQSGTGPPASVV